VDALLLLVLMTLMLLLLLGGIAELKAIAAMSEGCSLTGRD
jgi:hypothetical protein